MASTIPLKNKVRIALRTMRFGKGPRFASLFVTRKCNCACSYCKSINQPYPDISLEQWHAVIDRLHDWGVRIFSLTGGEPLVRKDIPDIVRSIARRKKAVCWMISNFKSVDKTVIDSLYEAGLQFLTCSLDSLDGKGVKSDGGALDLLIYAKKKGIIASTLTVVTKNNLALVPDIAREVTGRGLLFDMGLFQHVGGAFSPADTALKPESMAEVERLRKALKHLKMTTGLVSPSWTYLCENLALYDTMAWKCPANRDDYLVVNNNGSLMTCQEYADGPFVLDMKNLRDERWRIAKRATVECCPGCFYGCYYQKSALRPVDLLFDAYAMLRA
jgi:MoaA/NifB/PqqE/SkfB family radical SAM enzyme